MPYSFSVLELGKSVCLSPKMLELHCNHTKLFQRGKKMTSEKQWPLSDQFQWLLMLPKDLFISTKKEFIMNQVRITGPFVIHSKGQLISKCPFGVIVWTNKIFSGFLP